MKYIIDSDDVIGYTPKYAMLFGDGYMIQPLEDLEVLNSDYINEHFGDLQDTAYQKGFEDGKKEAESSEAIEQAKADAFNKGMLFKEEKIHDAFLRGVEKGKAVNDKGCEGCRYAGKVVTGPPCISCCNSYKNQWTAKSDKIEVGDEVCNIGSDTNETGIVTWRSFDDMYVMWSDGSAGRRKVNDYRKTGRHFDIASILEAMKHD